MVVARWKGSKIFSVIAGSMPGPSSIDLEVSEVAGAIAADPHLDRFAGAVLDGVGEQVGHDLIEPQRIEPRGHRPVGADGDPVALALPADLEARSPRGAPPRRRPSRCTLRVRRPRWICATSSSAWIRSPIRTAADSQRSDLRRAATSSRAPLVSSAAAEQLQAEQQRRERRLQLVGGDRIEQVAQPQRLAAVVQHRALGLDVLLRGQIQDEADHLVVAVVHQRDADQDRAPSSRPCGGTSARRPIRGRTGAARCGTARAARSSGGRGRRRRGPARV